LSSHSSFYPVIFGLLSALVVFGGIAFFWVTKHLLHAAGF
jgi:hypothetical protein